MKLSYVKEQRGMPFIKRGMRVELVASSTVKAGRITGGNESGNINVRFDGESRSQNCHPKWNTRYFDNSGGVIAEFIDTVSA